MNDRMRSWRRRGLLAGTTLFWGVFAVTLGRGQVLPLAEFEIQPPILQDVAEPEDDDVWLPNTFTLADLNEDGWADLVSINRLQAILLVRLSRGDGTFEEPISLPVVDIDDFELEPTSVAVGDVGSPFTSEEDGDIDGKADIVIGTYDGVIVIFVGDGEGNFQLREEDLYIFLSEVIDVDLADFDGDGRLDIAALDDFDEAEVMLNQAGAFDPDTDSFDTGGEETTSFEIASGDFDGNGDADLVVLNRDDRTISLLFGHGDGEFDEPQLRSTIADLLEPDQLPYDLAVADLEGDGYDDVVVINFGTFSDLQLLVRYGPDLMQSASFPAPFESTAIELGDFDGNGFLDALIAHDEGTVGTLFLPDDAGAGGFSDRGGSEIAGVSGGVANAAGNFAGDSLPDFVQLRTFANEFQVAVNVSNEPTPTATATPSPSPTVTETPTPTLSSTPTATKSVTPRPTPSSTATQTAELTATGTATIRPSPSPSSSPTRTTALDEDDGCTLVVPQAGQGNGRGSSLLLLIGLALAWKRRRARRYSLANVSRKATVAAAALLAARR